MSEPNEQMPPSLLILFGVLGSAVGLVLALVSDVPTVLRVVGFVALSIGGLLAQVGVIAAGVEYGMRRVRGY